MKVFKQRTTKTGCEQFNTLIARFSALHCTRINTHMLCACIVRYRNVVSFACYVFYIILSKRLLCVLFLFIVFAFIFYTIPTINNKYIESRKLNMQPTTAQNQTRPLSGRCVASLLT